MVRSLRHSGRASGRGAHRDRGKNRRWCPEIVAGASLQTNRHRRERSTPSGCPPVARLERSEPSGRPSNDSRERSGQSRRPHRDWRDGFDRSDRDTRSATSRRATIEGLVGGLRGRLRPFPATATWPPRTGPTVRSGCERPPGTVRPFRPTVRPFGQSRSTDAGNGATVRGPGSVGIATVNRLATTDPKGWPRSTWQSGHCGALIACNDGDLRGAWHRRRDHNGQSARHDGPKGLAEEYLAVRALRGTQSMQ